MSMLILLVFHNNALNSERKGSVVQNKNKNKNKKKEKEKNLEKKWASYEKNHFNHICTSVV
jgi:hypothetical protein